METLWDHSPLITRGRHQLWHGAGPRDRDVTKRDTWRDMSRGRGWERVSGKYCDKIGSGLIFADNKGITETRGGLAACVNVNILCSGDPLCLWENLNIFLFIQKGYDSLSNIGLRCLFFILFPLLAMTWWHVLCKRRSVIGGSSWSRHTWVVRARHVITQTDHPMMWWVWWGSHPSSHHYSARCLLLSVHIVDRRGKLRCSPPTVLTSRCGPGLTRYGRSHVLRQILHKGQQMYAPFIITFRSSTVHRCPCHLLTGGWLLFSALLLPGLISLISLILT